MWIALQDILSHLVCAQHVTLNALNVELLPQTVVHAQRMGLMNRFWPEFLA